MRAPATALPPFEVAVRGGRTAFARRQLIGVHRQTHRTPRKPPFESGVDEDLRQPFLFGLGAHKARSGNDHRPQTILDLPALQNRGGCPQVFDAAVGAGPDEDRVDLDLGQLLPRNQAHVVQAAAGGIDLAARKAFRVGDDASDRQHVFRAGAPGHDRGNVFAAQRHHLVELRVIIGKQRFPPGQRRFPLRPFRRMGATHDIGIGFLIRGDDTCAGAALDRHVADGHPPFHRQIADRLAAIFNHMAVAAGRAGGADHRQGDVLGGDSGAQLAGDLDLHVL